jgi:1,3-beta-glucan synthase
LLFILTPAAIIPYFDRLHSTMLFWLAPSQQIRPPIYSFRQRSQRRKIVFKCKFIRLWGLRAMLIDPDSIVYFLVQGCLVALIVLPLIFKDVLKLTPKSTPFGAVI